MTKSSKIKYQLRILGEGEDFEKRREIYHLLLYYDVSKRNNLLTRHQLDQLLRKIDIDFDDISKIEKEEEKYIQKHNDILREFDIENVKLLGCPKGIAIGEYIVTIEETKMKKDTLYYVVIPGFTIKEFISYISKLKKRKEPKPFTKNIPLVPYVYYTNYTKDDIVESIELFKKSGFIRLISSIFKGEIRYLVSDEQLNKLFFMVKIIHIYQFELIITKIIHFKKPDTEDKVWMAYFFGEHTTDILVAKAHELRRSFQNDNQYIKKYTRIKKNIRRLEKEKDTLKAQLMEVYTEVLKTNILLNDLVI